MTAFFFSLQFCGVREGERSTRERGGDWADGPARASDAHCAGRARCLVLLQLSVVSAGR